MPPSNTTCLKGGRGSLAQPTAFGAMDDDRAAGRRFVSPPPNFARWLGPRYDRYATIGVEPGAAAHAEDERSRACADTAV